MSGRLVGNLIGFVAMAAWATQFPLLAKLLETWDPVLMAAARTLIPGVVLLLVAGLMGALRGLSLHLSFDVMIVGGAGLGAATVLFVVGQSSTHPITASVIVSTLPLCSAVIGFATGEEKITLKLSAAIALALVGGAVCALAGKSENLEFNGGELFILAGVFLFAWYTRASLRRFAHLAPTTQAGITSLAAGYVCFVVFALCLPAGLAEIRLDLTPNGLLLLAWICIGSLALSMALWFWASRELGVTVAGMHHNMVPFYVVLMSAAFGAEVLPGHVLGAALVIAGAVLAQLPSPKRRAMARQGAE
ncbi:MAG: DMT family transporter [Alphaproteobacteria bacterium]|nr:DMT family transporter [Alphaproteobacteria bacterium]